MKHLKTIKLLIEQEIRNYLKEAEEEASVRNNMTPIRSFEEDPMMYILSKYPSLAKTLTLLLTDAYKDYITAIYIIAPKPTRFKIVLHNGQFFYLTYLGKAYEAKVQARRYYLMTIGDKERAIQAIAGLLELGAPLNVKGPDTEATASAAQEPAAPAAEETPAEEEKTES
jgi:hypothetical protein